jgi:hypothetical protein
MLCLGFFLAGSPEAEGVPVLSLFFLKFFRLLQSTPVAVQAPCPEKHPAAEGALSIAVLCLTNVSINKHMLAASGSAPIGKQS